MTAFPIVEACLDTFLSSKYSAMQNSSNILILVFIFLPFFAEANDLQIYNLQRVSSNELSFSLSWKNSWNTDQAPYNHDAVWVFAKIKQWNTGFEPLYFNETTTQIWLNSADAIITTVPDSIGFYVKPGILGTTLNPNVTIYMRFAENLPETDYEIRIFGIEMVYIPQGSYQLGDAVSQNSFTNGLVTEPLLIESENEITISTNSTNLGADYLFPPEANIPQSYPKGFKAIYCMKYEITQQQYTDFLNCLNYTQQSERTTAKPESTVGTAAMVQGLVAYRNGISIQSPSINRNPAQYGCDLNQNGIFNEVYDGQHIAVNWLNWNDLAAYLDWAGLRPLTELEFEKAARGSESPVTVGEFAWGTEYATDANNLVNQGTETESANDIIADNSGFANHGYEGVQGPMRTGFAASDSSDRLSSGASYYGVMELSGNVWEQCITVNSEALGFTELPGNGKLDEHGNANTPNWPNATAEGSGYRGGAWGSGIYEVGGFRDLAISDRYYAGLTANMRRNTAGGRGVRSAE